MGKRGQLKRKQQREYLARVQQQRREFAEVRGAGLLYDATNIPTWIDDCVVVKIDNVVKQHDTQMHASEWYNSQFDEHGEWSGVEYDQWDMCIRRDLKVTPPFKTMFVEHTWAIGDISQWQEGYFLSLDDSDSTALFLTIDGYTRSTNYTTGDWGQVEDTFSVTVRLNADGTVAEKPTYFTSAEYGLYYDDNDDEADDEDEGRFKLVPVFLALALMNCRNVEMIDTPSNDRISGLHQRYFGVPISRYKTLRVKPTGKRSNNSDPKEYQDLMPLHLRRGNFATYTDDAPLFGKFTGTFWRPATVVGSEKNGIVVKDYEVTPKT